MPIDINERLRIERSPLRPICAAAASATATGSTIAALLDEAGIRDPKLRALITEEAVELAQEARSRGDWVARWKADRVTARLEHELRQADLLVGGDTTGGGGYGAALVSREEAAAIADRITGHGTDDLTGEEPD